MVVLQAVDEEMALVVISSAWMEKRGWEAVRDVYKRACIVHCPKRAVIRSIISSLVGWISILLIFYKS